MQETQKGPGGIELRCAKAGQAVWMKVDEDESRRSLSNFLRTSDSLSLADGIKRRRRQLSRRLLDERA